MVGKADGTGCIDPPTTATMLFGETSATFLIKVFGVLYPQIARELKKLPFVLDMFGFAV